MGLLPVRIARGTTFYARKVANQVLLLTAVHLCLRSFIIVDLESSSIATSNSAVVGAAALELQAAASLLEGSWDIGREDKNLFRGQTSMKTVQPDGESVAGAFAGGIEDNVRSNDSQEQPPSTATVSNKATQINITVNQSGAGDYDTVQAAIDSIPISNSQHVTIRIYSGRYREKISIPSNKPFITLLGEGVTPPVISWNDTATSSGSTWASSTVAVDAPNFTAKRIIFENSAPAPPAGATGRQAIALRIGGDMATFYNCTFLGAQDTLCDWKGRHYFKNCFIQGSIDFIFGDGQSLYEECSIYSIATDFGAITAHYRQTDDDASGYSFKNCTISGTGSILLGRAWGPYSRVVFSSSSMTSVVDPVGWGDWGSSSADKTVYYAEFDNFGDGADLSKRVSYTKVLTEAEAAPFTTLSWIDGEDWLDETM